MISVLGVLEERLRQVLDVTPLLRYNSGKAARFGDIGAALHAASSDFTAKIDLAEGLRHPFVSDISMTGSFLNIKLDRERTTEFIVSNLTEDHYSEIAKGGKVLLEHTSINPNASPHVGRARNAVIGDALVGLMRACGSEVEVHYFVNDFGKQIALLLVQLGTGGIGSISFDDVLAEYVKVNERAKADATVGENALDWLSRAESGDSPALEELKAIASHSLAGQLRILAQLGIAYDYFDFESDLLVSDSLNWIEKRLWEIGIAFVDEHGRTVADLSKIGFTRDDGRYLVLRRANGSSMYVLRDLAYNMEKIRRCSEGRNIVVLGEDHKLYMEQVSLILTALGLVPPEQVYYAYVSLRDGKMSTRNGNVVLLDDFLRQAQQLALQRCRTANPDLTDEDIHEIAGKVANAAVRFSLLRAAPTKAIVFDLDEALRFEGATGPYLQYTAVRLRSILSRGQGLKRENKGVSDALWSVALLLDTYETCLRETVERLHPGILCDYLLRLAKSVNQYYANERVILDESVAAPAFDVVRSAERVLTHGLDALGVQVPQRL